MAAALIKEEEQGKGTGAAPRPPDEVHRHSTENAKIRDDVLGVDREALYHLQQQSVSQRETTKEELEALFSPSELAAQTTVFKVPYHGH